MKLTFPQSANLFDGYKVCSCHSGVDPDLLVFGKYFTTNVRVLPHMSSSRLNVSEPLTSDKRQFNYPPNPPVRSISPASTTTKKPTTPQATHAVPTAHEVQHNLPRCTTVQAATAQITPEHGQKMDSTLNPQQTTSTPQWASMNLRHTTTTLADEPDTMTDTLNQSIPTPPPVYATTAHPSSTVDYLDSALTSIPINEALSSSTTQQHLALQTTNSLATTSQNTMQSSSSSTTQQPLGLQTSALQTTNSLATTSELSMQSSRSSTIQQPLGLQTSTLQSMNSLPTASQDTMRSSSSSTILQPLGLQTSTLQTTNSLASQKSMQSFTKILTSAQQPLTQTTKQATSLSKSKLKYSETTVQTTVFETVSIQTYASSQSETSTTTKPLTSANVPLQTSTRITTAYEKIQTTTALKMNSALNPQQTTIMPQDIPLQTKTQGTPAYESSTWPSRTLTQTTALSQPKETTSIGTRTLKISSTTSPTFTTDGSTTLKHLTQSFTHTRMGNSATTGSLSSSLTAPTSSVVDSQPYPNDTKGYISRNITTGDTPQPGGDGSLTSVWHLAANTVLVALATCATITFCCCCSVFAALSWRGRRRRKGRYRTNLRCKRGSMRLIKYVIVRESS